MICIISGMYVHICVHIYDHLCDCSILAKADAFVSRHYLYIVSGWLLEIFLNLK